jgi:NYN domain-containing protein
MPEQTYLFIDGAYLRACYEAVVSRFFGSKGTLDFATVKGSLGANRVFYYDCLHDIQNQGESDPDFQKRVAAQQAEFSGIQGLPFVHLRLGSLSGKPPRLRQKKVDVLLAVEALDHAFRRNMNTACLIAGDLDFAPLVDSLVRLGTYVRVFYEKTSAARELYTAADMGQPITLATLHSWSDEKFRRANPLPNRFAGANPPSTAAGYKLMQEGYVDDETIQLWQSGNEFFLFMPRYEGVHSLQVNSSNREQLERFFEAEYGHIVW